MFPIYAQSTHKCTLVLSDVGAVVQVGFLDAMRFKGAAPEIVNCRLAMLGFVAAVAAGGVLADCYDYMVVGAFSMLLWAVSVSCVDCSTAEVRASYVCV